MSSPFASNMFNRLIDTLNALLNMGLSYKIVLPDGTEYGNLVTVGATEESAPRASRGTYSNVIDPKLTGLAIGDVASIEMPTWMEVPPSDFQSRCCARAHVFFGAGGYQTNLAENVVEVMRVR